MKLREFVQDQEKKCYVGQLLTTAYNSSIRTVTIQFYEHLVE